MAIIREERDKDIIVKVVTKRKIYTKVGTWNTRGMGAPYAIHEPWLKSQCAFYADR